MPGSLKTSMDPPRFFEDGEDEPPEDPWVFGDHERNVFALDGVANGLDPRGRLERDGDVGLKPSSGRRDARCRMACATELARFFGGEGAPPSTLDIRPQPGNAAGLGGSSLSRTASARCAASLPAPTKGKCLFATLQTFRK